MKTQTNEWVWIFYLRIDRNVGILLEKVEYSWFSRSHIALYRDGEWSTRPPDKVIGIFNFWKLQFTHVFILYKFYPINSTRADFMLFCRVFSSCLSQNIAVRVEAKLNVFNFPQTWIPQWLFLHKSLSQGCQTFWLEIYFVKKSKYFKLIFFSNNPHFNEVLLNTVIQNFQVNSDLIHIIIVNKVNS